MRRENNPAGIREHVHDFWGDSNHTNKPPLMVIVSPRRRPAKHEDNGREEQDEEQSYANGPRVVADSAHFSIQQFGHGVNDTSLSSSSATAG